jgi:HEAT repeats
MSKLDEYRKRLGQLKDWKPYLLKESGLPGPRGNLELAQVVAEEASPKQIEAFLSIPIEDAPENSSQVFLVFCGVTALGKRVARGDRAALKRMRQFASDPRWRVREAVAIGLQYFGDEDVRGLLSEMRRWSKGSWYEKRAAAAALAEPRLLREPEVATEVLQILDLITVDIEATGRETSEAFLTLRKSMGYCWSVAVAALPKVGKPLMDKWLRSKSPDVRWLMKQNLTKNRLLRMDAAWVQAATARLAS